MAINPALKPQYKVVPANYNEPKTQGSWVDIYSNKNRFVSGEYLNEAPLEAGVVVCATGRHPIHGYTKVAKPTAANSKILGVSQINPALLMDWDTTLNCWVFKTNTNVPIATTGNIYMWSEVPVEVGDKVYFRLAVNAALTRIGAVANAAGTGLELLPNAMFADYLTAPGLVAVSLMNA